MKHLSPPQLRLPLGIPINISITEKWKARGDPIMPRALSFSPAFLHYKEASGEERGEAFRGGSRKFRKGWPGTLSSHIDTFYFAENSTKNNTKFQKKGGRGTPGPPLNPPLALNSLLHSRSFDVKQCSSLSRPLRDDTKNGCEADFNYGSIII